MSKQTTEKLFSLQEFNEHKFDRVIPVTDLGVDKALIAYWRREGLLPFIQKGKWATLSFVEAIWIMKLDSLRRFGVKTDLMKKLAYYFIERAYHDNVPKKNLEYRRDLLEKKKVAGTITDQEHILLQDINEHLKDEVLLYALKWDVNFFSNLITQSVTYFSEAAILIFEDGQIVEQVFGGYNTYPQKEVDFSAPHIKISLNHYLKIFIGSEELSKFLLLSKLYSEEEERVLREVRNKNVHQITIELSDGKIKKVESTKNGTISGEQAKQIREILGLKNYEKITLDTRDEKTLIFKKTKKKYK
jgi:hypothetical protein